VGKGQPPKSARAKIIRARAKYAQVRRARPTNPCSVDFIANAPIFALSEECVRVMANNNRPKQYDETMKAR